jgi:acetolactate synthase-1/2/3 large subunit
MKLADYVINYLADLGVKNVFVVYGAAIGDLVDVFTRTDRIKYVCVMHEQAGAFAAETLTKISGTLGVTLVTSGPGGTNLLTGIANCWYDSIPNLYITGQINSQFLRKDPSIRQVGFQENDIVSMAQPITKYATMLREPRKIKWVLDKAVYEATHGRPGPVLIDIPIDVQKAEIDPEALEGFIGEDPSAEYKDGLDEKIDLYLNKLNESERPVLLIGGGIWLADALEEVRELGHILKIPCIPTWNAVDIFTDDYPYYRGRPGTYGGPGNNFAIQNADLLLTIGSRIPGRMTGGVPSSFARAAMKFFVDIDKANLDPRLQEVRGDIDIYCDAKVFTRALIDEAKRREIKPFGWWLDKTREWLEKYDTVRPEYYETKGIVHPYVFIRELSNQLGPDDVIVADCGGNVVVTYQAFKTKTGQRLISSNGNSPMGYSFAGAMGACFAPVKGRVICLIGDGGFNMNIQELQVVKNYNLPIKTFIMNNHVYGITKAFQETNFGGRYEAAGPKGYSPPNFVKVTEAYGIATETIQDHSDLKSKIKAVLEHEGPIVCDVNMHEYFKYEPRIFGWNTPIEDMYPYLSREEFISNMYIDPLPGWEHPVLPQGERKSME